MKKVLAGAIFCALATLIIQRSSATAASIAVTPASGHPSAQVSVSGTGFAASEAVDIYFDTTDVLLVVTSATGKITSHQITIPASALPGAHWVTGVGRKSGDAAQRSLTVSTPWAEFGYDGKNKRANPFENVVTNKNARNLDTAWKYTTGDNVESSPAISGGIVYVGSDDGNLYALNAITGSLIWSGTTGGAIVSSSPTVTNGVVYVGSSDNKLYAFNATTGALLWSALTGGFLSSSPNVVAGIVYIGSGDGKLYAFNATSGALVWSTNSTGSPIRSSPAVASGTVYVGSGNDNLYAFDAATGAGIWGVPTGNQVNSSPAVANGSVFVGSGDAKLYAFNWQDGAVEWTYTTGSGINGSPAVSGGTVYIESNNVLYAIDQSDGSVVWSAPIGNASFVNLSSPTVADGVVYVGASNGRLYAFDADSGASLWSAAAGLTFYVSAPAVSDGYVYMGGGSNVNAYALNGGENAAYRRQSAPPSFASLHPDRQLIVAQ